jgi:apolipoprotein D and lipocalin family protein
MLKHHSHVKNNGKDSLCGCEAMRKTNKKRAYEGKHKKYAGYYSDVEHHYAKRKNEYYGNDTKTTKVRFLHNVASGTDGSINLFMDDDAIIKNLSYPEMTGYMSLPAKKFLLTARPVTDKRTSLFTQLMEFKPGYNYTVTINGMLEDPKSIKGYRFMDDEVCPRPGNAVVKFINGAMTDQPLNVGLYLNDQNVFEDIEYGKAAEPYYKVLAAGRYDMQVNNTATGQNLTSKLPLNLVSGGIYTISTTGLNNGQFRYGVILSHDNKGKCDNLKENFNAEAYMGRWFQIASIPQPFSTNCVRSVAEYTLLEGSIKVVNTCYDKTGKAIDQVTGSAFTNKSQPAEMVVSFPGNNSGTRNNEDTPNYLVHDTDYNRYAIVGSPDNTGLYILARKPTISKNTYEMLAKRAHNLGYNVNDLVIDSGAVRD